MTRSFGTVVFSHGKESGPWGSKITAMAAMVRDFKLGVESVDYRGLDDPGARVSKLIDFAKDLKEPVVLVGSSMGGHVSAAAASRLQARGMFLLAPAFYMAGYEEYTPQDVACPTAIVHGWHDIIVPVENQHPLARENIRRPCICSTPTIGSRIRSKRFAGCCGNSWPSSAKGSRSPRGGHRSGAAMAGRRGSAVGSSSCACASSRRLSPNCSPQRLPMASNPAPKEAM